MKPSPSQLSALRKLAAGYVLTQSWGGRVSGPPSAWFPDYYDDAAFRNGKRYGDKYVHMNTFEALRKRAWIKQTELRDGISSYVITQAGLEAYAANNSAT